MTQKQAKKAWERAKMETERLILRPWKETDAEDLFKYAKDPEVGPPAGWKPHRSVEESLAVIRKILAIPGTYAVVLKGTDVPIGSVSLMFADVSDLANGEKECELGYWLGKPFWGQGLIPEAAREMLRHAFEDLGMEKVWCGYYDGNTKSKRVQEKCGFRHMWTTENVDVPQLNEKRTGHVNLITREEWEALTHTDSP